MHVEMTVVLFRPKGCQDLAATVLGHNTRSDLLDDSQQMRGKTRLELQQGANMHLRNNDHVLDAESRNRRPECEYALRLHQDLDFDQTRNHLRAIPIRLDHASTVWRRRT